MTATVGAMSDRCTRPGCSAPAAALLSFDPINCHVWIDHVVPDEPTVQPLGQVQALCAEHAGRTTPPRGWTMSVHRAVEPPVDVEPDDVEPSLGSSAEPRQDDRRGRPRSLLGQALGNVGNQRSVLTLNDNEGE